MNGQPAVVIVDKGDKPGTSPGKLFVAATGRPFPLRVLATGKARPGGKKTRCSDSSGKDSGAAGDELTFSRFNEELKLTAPPNPLDLRKAAPSQRST